jgi:hypothetical protein
VRSRWLSTKRDITTEFCGIGVEMDVTDALRAGAKPRSHEVREVLVRDAKIEAVGALARSAIRGRRR